MVDHGKLAELFSEAVALTDPVERDRFVRASTFEDDELCAELRSLLQAHDASTDFLEEPAVAEAAALVPDRLGAALEGSFIGPWRLDVLLQTGGMGSVFAATRAGEDFTQRAALKLVKVGLETPDLIARFSRERQLLATVEHPNIARLLDGGTTDAGLPWLAMDYVEGEPIDAFADAQRLSLQARLELFDQVADAIAYLHQNLITHRDIKPSNVLVDAHSRVKVLDFGIASLLNEATSLDASPDAPRISMGSAAPEQLLGETVSTATDVYSLGVLLYRLLAGVPPYRISSELTAADIRQLVCEDQPQLASVAFKAAADPEAIAAARRSHPSAVVRSIRGDLDSILAKALQKDPKQRYVSVAELRADIARHRESRPILERSDSALYRVRKFMRRHWRGLFATTATTLALAVGLAMAVWQADEARRQRDRAQAMNEFMQEVLAQGDPYEGAADKPIREVLEQASELLDSRFAGKPLLEAALRQSVASVQLSLLQLDAGEVNLRRARALIEQELPLDDELRLKTDALLAWLAYERENPDEAIAGFESVIERLSDKHDSEFRARMHNDFGVVLNFWGHFAESIRHQEFALALSPDSSDRPSTLNNIGFAYAGLGRYEDAKRYHLMAIEARRAEGPAGLVADLAYALNNYGNALSEQGRDDEALPYYLESLEVRYVVFGENSDSVAAQHLNVGRLLLDLQRPPDALPHLEKAAALLPEYRGEESVYTLVARMSLARAQHLVSGDSEERAQAAEVLERVVAAFQADERSRSSRFASQAAEWLADARGRTD